PKDPADGSSVSGAQTNGGGPVAPVAGLLGRLAGGDWQTELDAALAAVGLALRVDRCYVFQNLRGPDGRLWMDLRGEWDAPDVRSSAPRATWFVPSPHRCRLPRPANARTRMRGSVRTSTGR